MGNVIGKAKQKPAGCQEARCSLLMCIGKISPVYNQVTAWNWGDQ